MTARGIP